MANKYQMLSNLGNSHLFAMSVAEGKSVSSPALLMLSHEAVGYHVTQHIRKDNRKPDGNCPLFLSAWFTDDSRLKRPDEINFHGHVVSSFYVFLSIPYESPLAPRQFSHSPHP
jgi:hypothetical protein